jgi:hypothetical protein
MIDMAIPDAHGVYKAAIDKIGKITFQQPNTLAVTFHFQPVCIYKMTRTDICTTPVQLNPSLNMLFSSSILILITIY